MTKFAIVGHYCPTDEDPDEAGANGMIDKDVRVALFDTRGHAEAALPWWPDGVIVRISFSGLPSPDPGKDE